MSPEEIFEHRKINFLKLEEEGGFIKPSSNKDDGLAI